MTEKTGGGFWLHINGFYLIALVLLAFIASAQAAPPNNIILFIPDGLRAAIVSPATAPTMAALRDSGVNFSNSHSLFPTFTTPNASAMATGHYLGDTGNFGNTFYTGVAIASANGSVTPFIENDSVLADIDEHFAGNYLNEDSLLALARQAGYATAAIGKLGPVAIQDVTQRTGETTIIIDDATGHNGGIPLSASLAAQLAQLGLPTQTPSRGANGKGGDANTPGALVANIEQQQYFVDVTIKAILPQLKASGRPFMLVFWSRDPDGTQHNQGDSLGQLVPGINGPTSMAAIRNADNNLLAILQTLKALGLDKTTNVLVSADHGFSTISKQSATSPAKEYRYQDVPAGQLPPGFLAIDLAQQLGMKLHDPDNKNIAIDPTQGQHTRGNGLIGNDPQAPDIVVAANGGSDLLYLPQANAATLAPQVVDALLAQDYVSSIFVDDALGKVPGTLPLSAINLQGAAITPRPSIVVNFRSFDTGCDEPVLCAALVADTGLQQGQGMHGSFSRADTFNFMAARGPDFRQHFVDIAPSSNADIGVTIAHLLRLSVSSKGKLLGRTLTESLVGGKPVNVRHSRLQSSASANGLRSQLDQQSVGKTRYFDAAGFTGRSVGLKTPTSAPAK